MKTKKRKRAYNVVLDSTLRFDPLIALSVRVSLSHSCVDIDLFGYEMLSSAEIHKMIKRMLTDAEKKPTRENQDEMPFTILRWRHSRREWKCISKVSSRQLKGKTRFRVTDDVTLLLIKVDMAHCVAFEWQRHARCSCGRMWSHSPRRVQRALHNLWKSRSKIICSVSPARCVCACARLFIITKCPSMSTAPDKDYF